MSSENKKTVLAIVYSKINVSMFLLFLVLFLIGLYAGGIGGVILCLTSFLGWPIIGYNSLSILISMKN